jgi:hypothetical protein
MRCSNAVRFASVNAVPDVRGLSGAFAMIFVVTWSLGDAGALMVWRDTLRLFRKAGSGGLGRVAHGCGLPGRRK